LSVSAVDDNNGLALTKPAGGGPVIRLRDVSKRFGHVQALESVSLELFPGEILAVVGDNGAGKSTMAKVVARSIAPDRGQIEIGGERIQHASTRDIQELGVETVYQDLALAPDLSIADNIFLGREQLKRRRFGLRLLDRRTMDREAREILARVGISLPTLRAPVRNLSGGQQQAIAVARAAAWARLAILMDEPTAALALKQTALTNEIIVAAARSGLGVLLITHDIPNVLTFADRVVVMRQGRVVESRPASELGVRAVLDLMLGENSQEASEN
jgi:ABC-type sugar transport system ATPase subunit